MACFNITLAVAPSAEYSYKWMIFFHFASAFFAAVSNQWTARSSAVWSCCKPHSNRYNGHESTIWLMVCFCPQLQDSDVDRPHWCKSARHVPRPVRKLLSIDQVCRGRSKPGCRIVGSGTKDWLTTGADVQTFLHWAFMSTGLDFEMWDALAGGRIHH